MKSIRFLTITSAILFCLILHSCKKDKHTPPLVTTTSVSSISSTTATSGGEVTNDGGATVSARGVCWSTGQTPTTGDSKTTDGSGTGSFSSTITGLTANTIYYVRAYAINSSGTGYGSEVSFTTKESITDIDGNVYTIVTIGTQVWMAENLKTTKFRNGDLIGTTAPATLDISSETTAEYQWAYNGDESNVTAYGRLYTRDAVTDSRNVCPTGWHVPSDAEWTALTDYLGGENVAGGKLKETNFTHWLSPNRDATNETGFTALPDGWRGNYGGFYDIGSRGSWWSSSEYDTDGAWFLGLGSEFGNGYSSNGFKWFGLSVRCLKD